MASQNAIIMKRTEAARRLDTASARLVERFGVEVPPPVKKTPQADLTHALELERMADLLEAILRASDSGLEADANAEILEGTVADVAASIEATDDPEALAALLAVEQTGRNRKGVIAAIERRMAELDADDEEPIEDE